MTRPNITPGEWIPNPEQPDHIESSIGLSVAYTWRNDECEANSKAIAALPDLLAALENALEAVQISIAPLYADGANGAAETCEDSAKEIKAALIKAGYTFP